MVHTPKNTEDTRGRKAPSSDLRFGSFGRPTWRRRLGQMDQSGVGGVRGMNVYRYLESQYVPRSMGTSTCFYGVMSNFLRYLGGSRHIPYSILGVSGDLLKVDVFLPGHRTCHHETPSTSLQKQMDSEKGRLFLTDCPLGPSPVIFGVQINSWLICMRVGS